MRMEKHLESVDLKVNGCGILNFQTLDTDLCQEIGES